VCDSEHSWYDNTNTLEVLCELCGVEQFVGKAYWDYLGR
jgi:hypothetical protein